MDLRFHTTDTASWYELHQSVGPVRRLSPAPSKPGVLYTLHYPCLAGHPPEGPLYESMPCKIYWPHKASNVYTPEEDCCKCACNRAEQTCTRHRKLVSAWRPLEFIAMDILRPLPKSTHGNQFVVVMRDPYSKLTCALPTIQTTALHVAWIVFDH